MAYLKQFNKIFLTFPIPPCAVAHLKINPDTHVRVLQSVMRELLSKGASISFSSTWAMKFNFLARGESVVKSGGRVRDG
jgi:hypothetical protein